MGHGQELITKHSAIVLTLRKAAARAPWVMRYSAWRQEMSESGRARLVTLYEKEIHTWNGLTVLRWPDLINTTHRRHVYGLPTDDTTCAEKDTVQESNSGGEAPPFNSPK